MFDNLYNALTNGGVLTDSIDKFKSSFQDEAYRRKVFNYITKQGYYNLDFDRFESGYYSKDDIVEEEEPKEVCLLIVAFVGVVGFSTKAGTINSSVVVKA